jgi:hypothetical protein
MRIVANQSIAGCPALKVRDFLWKHQLTGIIEETVQTSLDLNPTDASEFLNKLVALGLVRESHRHNGYTLFDLTDCGVRLAYASAAKPIHRKTAERILAEFMERVHAVNATPEISLSSRWSDLFGSFLSDVEQLGDVNVAVNLESKARGEVEFQKWSRARRSAARAKGRSFPTIVEQTYWPKEEIYLQLKARFISLKLSDLSHVADLPNLSYRILLGDPEQIAALMPSGRIV